MLFPDLTNHITVYWLLLEKILKAHRIVTQLVSCILDIFLGWTRASKWKFCADLKLRAYLMLHLQKIRIYSHHYFAARFVLHSRLSEVPTQRLFAFNFNIRLSTCKHIYVHICTYMYTYHKLSIWYYIFIICHVCAALDGQFLCLNLLTCIIFGEERSCELWGSSVSHKKKPANAQIYY